MHSLDTLRDFINKIAGSYDQPNKKRMTVTVAFNFE